MSLESSPAARSAAIPVALIDELLGRYGLHRQSQPTPVPGSVLNENFHVDTDDGPRFIRLHRPRASAERIRLEHSLVVWAGQHGIPVSSALADHNGRTLHTFSGRLVSLFPWIHGHALQRETVTPAESSVLGDMHGRLHATLARYPDVGLSRDGSGTNWNTQASIDALNRIDDLIRYYPAPPPEQLRLQGVIRAQLEVLESGDARPASDFAGLRRQACHGDYHERNVLADGSGAIIAVVDWEMAGLLPPIFELVRAISFVRLFDSPLLEPYLDAYRRHARFTAAECHAGVEMFWQFLIHDTWVFTSRFIRGDRRVDEFLPTAGDLLARFGDPAFRSSLEATLVRITT